MKNTKIIPIKGGLGNQLFQYAYGRKLEIIDKKNVIFDISFFKDLQTNPLYKKDLLRPFLLDRFNINPASKFSPNPENYLLKFTKKIFAKITKKFPLFQSEKYFEPIKDIILQEITLKNPLLTQAQNIANNIKLQTNSVSIHIRRGDYLNNSHHPICPPEYYYHAEHYIKSKINNPLFFIFSDDIEWVRKNLQISDSVFVSDKNISEVEEMFLMSQCKHNIIANSTFSWWGAYLNRNDHKIVIAPKQWTKHKSANELDILPKSWIQM